MNAKKNSYRFMWYYALVFALNGSYNNFIPIFFNQQGFSQSEIGALLAGGPLIALLAQPFWGSTADRSASRNRVLILLLIGSGCCILFYPLGHSFKTALSLLAAFSFFQSAISPIGDAITLDYVQRNKKNNYGKIRLFGSLGYALSAVIAGRLAGQSIYLVFGLYATLSICTCAIVYTLPKGPARASSIDRKAYLHVLSIPEVIPILILTLLVYASFGFHAGFFGIFLQQKGGSLKLLGFCLFLQAISEIPFLFFSGRLTAKWGVKKLLFASALFMALRWAAMSMVQEPYLMPWLSLMHGFSVIVYMHGVSMHFSEIVPRELRASGQAVFAMSTFIGISLLGSLGGGVLSERCTISKVYLLGAILNVVSVLVLGYIIPAKTNKMEVFK